MSLETTLARIQALESMLAPRAPAAPPPGGTSFQSVLQGAAPAATASTVLPAAGGGGGGGGGIVQAAQGEIGQSEHPPGSNDSPRIAEYRRAVPGGPVGPWCAYFVSWAAAQAGTPLGENGQGYASVSQVWAWGQRTGRALPNGPGVQPQPGDLILWGGRHIGLVESVLPDGRVQTIEGNSSDQVARRTHPPGSATGYVRPG